MTRIKPLPPITLAVVGILGGPPARGDGQAQTTSWLDEPAPETWNAPGQPIPPAPAVEPDVFPRCRELTRPAELEEDGRVRDAGWALDGPYQGGWNVLVIRGTASYDGMCRPLQFQVFVFVDDVFAGTLSPSPMDSRTDGALGRVFVRNDTELIAEYARYAADDPACCPSRTTTVSFEIADGEPVLRPVSATTSP